MTLHDAIDKDHFIIDDIRYADTEIQEMSIDDLETLKMRIMKKISGISASLKEKQIDYANSGKRASKNWYMNRKLALSINQRVLTYISSLIKKKSKAEKTFGDFFVDAANKVLSDDLFNELHSLALQNMDIGRDQ